ncbi:hypothetical protein CALVIDRAFT_559275 [Calocera viscosa TUFC12733]|uniref:RNI-like protein n=1 Tax=Calocera viscosa (strain TUFC12733) TaxID=1330018 RepID=A0A167S0G9_CALVF|nr:hypothetical protein CALVIDRAFT_559275 [Calocera viscosa TUFC12733]
MSAHGIVLVRRPSGNQIILDEEGGEIKGGVVHMGHHGSPPYLNGFPRQELVERTYVPSLFDLCLAIVKSKPSLVDSITEVLSVPQAVRCIHALIRSPSDLRFVNPLTWLGWVKTCGRDLGEELLSYPYLALSDGNVLELARCPMSLSFCLLVNLNLNGSDSLDDSNIRQLGMLENLCVLDTSHTGITHAGVQALSQALMVDGDGQLRGPWRLRVWKLARCTRITSTAVEWLYKWPLLCALDLRGTRIINMYDSSGWHECKDTEQGFFGKHTIRHLSTSKGLFTCFPATVDISMQRHGRQDRMLPRHAAFSSIEDPLSPQRSFQDPLARLMDHLKRNREAMVNTLTERRDALAERTLQNEVATAEADTELRQTAALAFYRPLTERAPQEESRTRNAQNANSRPKKPQLFCRAPPPHSVLTQVVEAAQQARAVSELKVQTLRESEVGVARKRQKTMPSVLSIYARSPPVQHTSSVQVDQHAPARTSSPFARKATNSERLRTSMPGSMGGKQAAVGKARGRLALFRPP